MHCTTMLCITCSIHQYSVCLYRQHPAQDVGILTEPVLVPAAHRVTVTPNKCMQAKKHVQATLR